MVVVVRRFQVGGDTLIVEAGVFVVEQCAAMTATPSGRFDGDERQMPVRIGGVVRLEKVVELLEVGKIVARCLS